MASDAVTLWMVWTGFVQTCLWIIYADPVLPELRVHCLPSAFHAKHLARACVLGLESDRIHQGYPCAQDAREVGPQVRLASGRQWVKKGMLHVPSSPGTQLAMHLTPVCSGCSPASKHVSDEFPQHLDDQQSAPDAEQGKMQSHLA
eukprot:CAMPEP_0117527452 /NCGR_PEP_ID=MMETSP0784-20121206/36806_1 /TAXON_ID=39447 /ORGANISM="" /LENGTH=145 /DNA_ID=CAMNT_0005323707 /DNA_START=179 /DNA_END=617 /DNA_ORIENTATION=-